MYYRLFAHILGIEANRQWFIDDILCLRVCQKPVNVGCGAADILDRLPGSGVEYVGLDISDIYPKPQRLGLRLAAEQMPPSQPGYAPDGHQSVLILHSASFGTKENDQEISET